MKIQDEDFFLFSCKENRVLRDTEISSLFFFERRGNSRFLLVEDEKKKVVYCDEVFFYQGDYYFFFQEKFPVVFLLFDEKNSKDFPLLEKKFLYFIGDLFFCVYKNSVFRFSFRKSLSEAVFFVRKFCVVFQVILFSLSFFFLFSGFLNQKINQDFYDEKENHEFFLKKALYVKYQQIIAEAKQEKPKEIKNLSQEKETAGSLPLPENRKKRVFLDNGRVRKIPKKEEKTDSDLQYFLNLKKELGK